MLAYIAFGANLGDRAATWELVQEKLNQEVGSVRATSSLYETEPVGGPEQPLFINAVLALETNLKPLPLLQSLLRIERSLGRIRTIHWGPRKVDLDLLMIGDLTLNLPGPPELILPHPRLTQRRFVLTPLAEIAPQMVHPTTGKRITKLLDACPDTASVIRFQP